MDNYSEIKNIALKKYPPSLSAYGEGARDGFLAGYKYAKKEFDIDDVVIWLRNKTGFGLASGKKTLNDLIDKLAHHPIFTTDGGGYKLKISWENLED